MMERPPILRLEVAGAPIGEAALETSPFWVGRDPDGGVVLDYTWISRRHLCFEKGDRGWTVRSEGRNEVRLNGAVLESARPLLPGDVLTLGPMSIVFARAGTAHALDFSDQPAPAATIELSVKDVFDPKSATRYLTMLGELSAALSGARDVEAVAARASSALMKALDARAAFLAEVGPSGEAEVLGAQGGPVPVVSRSLILRAVNAGTTIEIDGPPGPKISRGPVLVAPLGSPSQGVVYADRAPEGRPFDREECVFATVLAHLTGAALASARKAGELQDARDRMRNEREGLARDIERRGGFGALVGTSVPMQKLAEKLSKVAPAEATVLIGGETGSGKELVAREIHRLSPRKDAPFFAINCAALPESLLESELFGHRRGAFSGADLDRKGMFEIAQGGTVFLDEVAELSLAAQAKLLRVLEAKEILPLGGSAPIAVDVRLVAATNRDLQKMVEEKRFRQDLYFRLNMFPVALPALRERKEDVPALVRHFLAKSAEARRKSVLGPTPEAMRALEGYDYPGNVRELAHIVERAAILADENEAIDVVHLPEEMAYFDGPADAPAPPRADKSELDEGSLKDSLMAHEKKLILEALRACDGNRTHAAKRLRMSLRAFMEKLRRYEINFPTRAKE